MDRALASAVALPGLADAAARAGFEPGWGHVSSAEEWDDYEWS